MLRGIRRVRAFRRVPLDAGEGLYRATFYVGIRGRDDRGAGRKPRCSGQGLQVPEMFGGVYGEQ